MAGSILISQNVRRPVSSRQFDYLVQYLRESFAHGSEAVRDEVFRPCDEGGMDFISAKALTASDFAVFSAALDRAREAAGRQPTFSAHTQIWDDLREMVRSDPRYGA